MPTLTAVEILAKCDKLMWELAHRAAVTFREDAADWYQDLALEIVRFADRYDSARGAVTTWVHLRWCRLVGLRKNPHLKRNRRPEPIDLGARRNVMRDPRACNPADVASQREEGARVRAEFDRLPRRQRAVLGGRFGLTDVPDGPASLARSQRISRAYVYALTRAALGTLATAFGADPGAVTTSEKAARTRRTLEARAAG